jgi:hypothetical protein
MIKRRILLALLLAGAACVPLAAQAQINISIGDQDYYTRGSSYVDGGYRYVWVPGHWNSKHHWIHGHYARRDRVGVGIGIGLGSGGVYIHP